VAAQLSHASATPSSLELTLMEMSVEDVVPTKSHLTDYGTVLRYVLGVRYRTATLDFYITSAAQHDQFWQFYRSVTNANTRFQFIADNVNFPSDIWSAYFMSAPEFERDRRIGGARIAGTLRVDIQDAPVSL
jgi:hypothetical protein